jgi:hypothetical protein
LAPVSAFIDESSANALYEIAAIPQNTTGKNFRMCISPFKGYPEIAARAVPNNSGTGSDLPERPHKRIAETEIGACPRITG